MLHKSPRTPPFLLVHGAFSGGWLWDRVRPLLQDVGHEVFTPTLTGLGDRADSSSPDIGLSTHVADVVRLIEAEDLQDVVLVLYSYAGMLAPGVAAAAADRLERLVFLDAFVPDEGDRCFDLMPLEAADSIRRQAEAEGEGWRFPPFPMDALGVLAEENVRWIGQRLVEQPLKTYEEPVQGTSGEWKRLPRTYIACTESAFVGVLEPFAQMARTQPGWSCVELASGHSPMISAPDALVRVLTEATR